MLHTWKTKRKPLHSGFFHALPKKKNLHQKRKSPIIAAQFQQNFSRKNGKRMATFIPELSNYKRHDGTYAVNVRIYHNGLTLRKVLDLVFGCC